MTHDSTGYSAAGGYAASLRQMADWIDEATQNIGSRNAITMDDLDTEELRAAASFIEGAERSDAGSAPVAWIVKWSTKHTPKNASAYLNEKDAQRAASNVKMYADASDVVIIPTFAGTPATSSANRGGEA